MWLLFEFYLSTDIDNITFSCLKALENKASESPYFVTRARFFLIRSAACLRVMYFLQSGQYLTLFDVEAKAAPHTEQRRLSSLW